MQTEGTTDGAEDMEEMVSQEEGEIIEDFLQEDWPLEDRADRPRARKMERVQREVPARKPPRQYTGGVKKISVDKCSHQNPFVEQHAEAQYSAKWQTPEVEAWQMEMQRVSWAKGAAIAVGIGLLYHLSAMAGGVVEDMMLAYELDVPDDVLPTRSAYAGTPIIGRVFQLMCDVGDLIRVNSAFVSRYAGAVPWLVASPVLVPAAVSMMPAITASGTAAASLLPLLR